ncbi:winged helix-turn-helix transcriptional regulator [Aldersonia kunmingensis]|uniref:winged helix-turn-helix transcriptional regulator n=1 Tax=Aldersonia kunmingensis TaxID=408066 RepID=UPI00083130B0|nr:helix-turn-helix domain-containing protein [Aldersonia kunmingensis]
MPAVMEEPLNDLSKWKAEECSVAKAMDIVGTRSAILLLREAYYGTTRFDGFASRVGITEAVAAKQLKRLTEAGLLTKQPYREAGQRTRHEYVLTDMGRDLLPAVLALMQWGDKYLQEAGSPLLLVEDSTGSPVRVEVRSEAGNEVELEQLRVRFNRNWRRPKRRESD